MSVSGGLAILKSRLIAVLVSLLVVSTPAQKPRPGPRFEDFLVRNIFSGTPARPALETTEEREFRTVIRRGVAKGWGVDDGITGRPFPGPGPNFAGHYVIVAWGCGSPCLMAAIVDLKTGRVFPPPFHHGPGGSYFHVPWAFPMDPPLSYRLDSRLLIANICEAGESQKCGAHYFVMAEGGPRLIRTVLEK